MIDVPVIVRNKALVHGAAAWLDALPDLVRELEEEWALRFGAPLDGARRRSWRR